MNIITAVALGAIQGLTEFLPVSSSGHLVLFQKIFGVSEPALFFDTMVHVGTLAAVVTVLWRDIWAILKKPLAPLTVYLIIATLPAVFFGLIFKKPVERAFETGQFLGLAFLATSALLATVELLAKRACRVADIAGNSLSSGDHPSAVCLKQAEDISWLDALIVGGFQAIAIFPGVSRSGATLSGTLFRKFDRDFAVRFSFLLSIPVILGAVVLQTKDLVKGGAEADVTHTGIGAAAVILGTLSAAVVGFFAVRLMLKIVRKKSLWGFAVYMGILGLLVLVDGLAVHLVF